MSNALINSMIRGFGSTLGRKAANSLTSSNRAHSVQQTNFSKKQLTLISENEVIKEKLIQIKNDAELAYANGKITKNEYEILMSDCNESINTANTQIEKLKSVGSESTSIWPVLIGVLMGICGFLWMVRLINS